MHLGLAVETLEVGDEMAMVGADGAAQGVVILKGGMKAEGKHGARLEARGDDAGVVLLALLVEAGIVFCIVLRDEDGEIACGEEENLISKETGETFKRGRAAVTS